MRTIYVDKNIPKVLLVKALKPLWPGVVFSPLSPARYEEMPEPELPGPRWVRVQNLQCGICASDVSLLFVDASPSIAPLALPGNQRVYLGHEVLGVVTEIGSHVSQVKVGDRVIMYTRFTEATCLSQEIDPPCRHCAEGNHKLCENTSAGVGPRGVGGGWGDGFTAHETEVYPIPDDLTDDQAMMIEPFSTGLRAVLRRTPGPGEHALIVGSGIVGLNTLQCLRAVSPECHITMIARHPHQADMARRLGADEVAGDEDGYQATARITGAKLYEGMFNNRMLLGGFEVIYDCVGSARTLQDSLRWARAGGAVVMIGVKLGPLKLDLIPIWYQEVDLVGLYSYGAEVWEGQTWRTYDLAIELMRRGKLTVDGLITHRFPLGQWRQAVSTALDKRTGTIKVVFDYSLT
ncbi:MAG: alcohol dehydrogenase catalytic domain-containing protein [Anaerolineales bacterium]|nr:MAG: alcohol dehydrogenase catalytic domain-containing protein [Anaerolineales bacterium]